MTLHQVIRPTDARWHLTLTTAPISFGRRRLMARDDHGQIWESTVTRRWPGTEWRCGHEREVYTEDRTSQVVRLSHNTYHNRYWSKVTSNRRLRGAPSQLCEMTSNLSPYTGYETTPIPQEAPRF